MAAAVAGPWRAPGLAMAPGGHLDSGIFIVVIIAKIIVASCIIATIKMIIMLTRYGWGGQ